MITTHSSETVPALPAATTGLRQPLRALLLFGVPCAVLSLLIGLRSVAQATLPHILVPGEYVNFQDVTDGLPVPRLLAWNLGFLDLLMGLRDLSGLSLLLAALFVCAPLWLLAVRQINPTFRLFGPISIASPSISSDSHSSDSHSSDSHSSDSVGLPVDVLLPAAPIDLVDLEILPDEPIEPADNIPGEPIDDTVVSEDIVIVEAASLTVDDESTAETVTTLPTQQTSYTPSTLAAPLEFYGLIKATTLLLMLGLPLTAFWILVDFGENTASMDANGLSANSSPVNDPSFGIIWLIRLILLGSIFWAGFHREGIAGDFTRREWNDARLVPPLILKGALFGLVTYALCRLGLPQHMEETLLHLQTLGTLNISTWSWFISRCLLAFVMVGFAIGAVFVLLNSKDSTLRQKISLFFAPLIALGVALLALQAFTPTALASRFDIRHEVTETIPANFTYRSDRPNSGVPDSPPAALELARQLNLTVDKEHSLPGRALVYFDVTQSLLSYQNSYTLDGLPSDKTSSEKIAAFLKLRDYRTAYSWIAIKTVYNALLMQFDTSAGIEVGLLDLTHCPHNKLFANTLLQMFSICAATPRNQELLDIWSDESKFDFPDRNSRRLMGDLYRRLGNAEKALQWYRKADMPSSFLKRVQSEPVMFHEGQLEGTLLLNGKPLSGVQVAVVPTRMNGLPRGLEPLVYGAREQMLSRNPRFATPLFPMFNTQPYSLRWISAAATTDSAGHYKIDHLTEGAYTVLCSLPPSIHTAIPEDDRLHILHPPRPFALNYAHPSENIGTTSIEFK